MGAPALNYADLWKEEGRTVSSSEFVGVSLSVFLFIGPPLCLRAGNGLCSACGLPCSGVSYEAALRSQIQAPGNVTRSAGGLKLPERPPASGQQGARDLGPQH